MKNGFNLMTSPAFLATMLLLGCSAQHQEGTKADVDLATTEASTRKETKPDIMVFSEVDGRVKTQINGFLPDYFALNKALIADNQEGAKAAALKLSETIRKFEMTNLTAEQMDFYLIQVSALSQGLKGIAESPDIEKTRMELANVSESLYALVKAYHPNESSLYYQFCPMARNGEGANWLSGSEEIVNPYMGQMMPECGRTQEILH